jgi:hypothetical protein
MKRSWAEARCAAARSEHACRLGRQSLRLQRMWMRCRLNWALGCALAQCDCQRCWPACWALCWCCGCAVLRCCHVRRCCRDCWGEREWCLRLCALCRRLYALCLGRRLYGLRWRAVRRC